MNHNEALNYIFEKAIRHAVDRLQQEFAAEAVTDLFVYPNPDGAEFSVFNDDHVCLAKEAVKEWASEGEDSINDEAEVEKSEPILKEIIAKLAQEGIFENLNLQKPFSVAMVDEDFDSLSELYFLDDDSVNLDENLIKQVDKELGDFFKQLMADV